MEQVSKRPVIDTHNHFLDGPGGFGKRLINPMFNGMCKGKALGEGFYQ